ncbi:hypothetical protein Plhal304r1_c013g0049801 [Plasmopara halstedii]
MTTESELLSLRAKFAADTGIYQTRMRCRSYAITLGTPAVLNSGSLLTENCLNADQAPKRLFIFDELYHLLIPHYPHDNLAFS